LGSPNHSLLIITFFLPPVVNATVFRIGSTHLVILGGLAELFAGSISMGLGAYLAALTDTKHYEVEEARERRQVLNSADLEDEEMYRLFAAYGIEKEVVRPLAQHLRSDPDAWIKVRLYYASSLLQIGNSWEIRTNKMQV
jgi:VIT1/CCC1 family predicted Fe2+/Mn2+ transporter